MRLNEIVKFIIAILIAQFAGVIGSFFTVSSIDGWYSELMKPALNPPNWVFGPVWTLLYALMGVSLYLVWRQNFNAREVLPPSTKRAWNPLTERLWRGDLQKVNAVFVFSLQLVLNVVWSIVFFSLNRPDIAFFVIVALWFSIISLIVNFYIISKSSAYLLVPYLAWVSFAMYLNYSIWALN